VVKYTPLHFVDETMRAVKFSNFDCQCLPDAKMFRAPCDDVACTSKSPALRPATTCSPDLRVESRCSSTLRARSNTTSGGAPILVINRMSGIGLFVEASPPVRDATKPVRCCQLIKLFVQQLCRVIGRALRCVFFKATVRLDSLGFYFVKL
jgi:hypothetical protein